MKKFDLHVHSIYSHDGFSSLKDILDSAFRKGLDGIAITDHNSIEGGIVAKNLVHTEDFLVIIGIEVSTTDGHVIGLGVQEHIPTGLSPQETIDSIWDQGALAVIPHPYTLFRARLKDEIRNLDFDAVEVFNSRGFARFGNWKAVRVAKELGKPMIAGSDAHVAQSVGNAITIIERDELSFGSLQKAILTGETKFSGKTTPVLEIARQAIRKRLRR